MATFQRYLVLTPFARADLLEKILRIRKLDAVVEETQSGAIVYHDLPVKQYHDWDIAELLGEMPESKANAQAPAANAAQVNADLQAEADLPTGSPEMADGTARSATESDLTEEFTAETSRDPVFIAQTISQLSPYGVVLFTVELGDDIGGESGVSGLVHAQRVVNGEITEELAPGMVLAVLDQRIEDLLIAAPPSGEAAE